MGISMKFYRYITLFIISLAAFVCIVTPVQAQGGTISMSPDTGTYAVGQTFTVTVKIDGGGFPFNAAKASVLVSPALAIQDVSIGDCGFAFVKPPVQSDPSFVGVILGGSAKSCSLYTLTIRPVLQGKGTITFVNSSVKSYKSAVDILTSIQNATFTVTAPTSGTQTGSITPAPIQSPSLGVNGTRLYDIVFRISQPQNLSSAGIYVVLDPNLPTQKTAIPSLFPGILNPDSVSGTVTFSSVPQGAHIIATYYSSQLLSKQVVYVTGASKTLVFGVSTKRSVISWQLIVGIAAALMFFIIIAMIIYRLFHRSTPPHTEPSQPMFQSVGTQQ